MRTRTRGKILLRNCARRSKVSKPLMSEGVGELKWACPLCSHIGNTLPLCSFIGSLFCYKHLIMQLRKK